MKWFTAIYPPELSGVRGEVFQVFDCANILNIPNSQTAILQTTPKQLTNQLTNHDLGPIADLWSANSGAECARPPKGWALAMTSVTKQHGKQRTHCHRSRAFEVATKPLKPLQNCSFTKCMFNQMIGSLRFEFDAHWIQPDWRHVCCFTITLLMPLTVVFLNSFQFSTVFQFFPQTSNILPKNKGWPSDRTACPNVAPPCINHPSGDSL